MDFSSAADELYGLPPGEFVEARTRLAREAKANGDAALAKRITALRRPTLSAWAVNLLSRSAPGDLDRLLGIGAEIRAAWASGGRLGDLERHRAELIGRLVRRTRELADDTGNPLREQAVREVEDTLQAATVDPDIAGEVRAGRLAQPRSHTGFGLAGFPVAPETPVHPTKARPAKASREAKEMEAEAERAEARPAEKAAPPDHHQERAPSPERPKPAGVGRISAARAKRAETLRRRAEEAERTLAERAERAAAACEEADASSAEVGRLRRELNRAVAERDSAARRAERAEQARSRAQEAAREARKAAKEAERDRRHS